MSMSCDGLPTTSTYSFMVDFEDDICVVCREDLKTDDDKTVCHPQGGEKHPLHLRCAILSLNHSPFCPSCRVCVDPKNDYQIHEIEETEGDRKRNVLKITAISILASVVFTELALFYSSNETDHKTDFSSEIGIRLFTYSSFSMSLITAKLCHLITNPPVLPI